MYRYQQVTTYNSLPDKMQGQSLITQDKVCAGSATGQSNSISIVEQKLSKLTNKSVHWAFALAMPAQTMLLIRRRLVATTMTPGRPSS